jgi:hypothetical protein
MIPERRGYKTVGLRLGGHRRLKLFTSRRVANAAREVTEKLDTLYYGVRLGMLLEAVYERGKIEGRGEVFRKLDGLKATVRHRLPGRPARSN